MRQIINFQQQLGEVNIADIELDLQSRDDIPNILRGLQYVYCTTPIKDKLFNLLEASLSEQKINFGRKGMFLWRVFVLAVLRTTLNCDYDRLQNLANSHKEIRQMLGHDEFADSYQYPLQTLKDNVRLLTPELLEEINTLIVQSGHAFLGRKTDTHKIKGRTDSFVVETNVHYPTDISLLYDAMRKAIQLTSKQCVKDGHSNWRQSKHNLKNIKAAMRRAQQAKRSHSKNREQVIVETHREYIQLAKRSIVRLQVTASNFHNHTVVEKIQEFIAHAERQIDQINRRVLKNEIIPASEKVYSIFEPHTEWVDKGKANGMVELGLKVCVVEDQDQFILHHRIMRQEVDTEIAVSLVKEVQRKFPNFRSCSFDKGFASAINQRELERVLDEVILPQKGKLSSARKEVERSEGFVAARHQHSAVESAINCLEHHGLDECKDKGIDGFSRYVAIAIVGSNLQRLGCIIRKKERASEKRRKRRLLRLAA